MQVSECKLNSYLIMAFTRLAVVGLSAFIVSPKTVGTGCYP